MMKSKKQTEIKVIFWVLAALFLMFLAAPVVQLLLKSFASGQERE